MNIVRSQWSEKHGRIPTKGYDYRMNWEIVWAVLLGRFGQEVLVLGRNEQEALDNAIDWADEHWPGFVMDREQEEELIQDAIRDGHTGDDAYCYLDEYISGGNAGLYLNTHNVMIERVL